MIRLFQPFTQAEASTTRKFGGTGLGLALTRTFCQMMAGDVTVHSVPGEGSVFTIKLPATVIEPVAVEPEALIEDRRQVPAAPDIVATEGEAAPAPRTCVLVIDDDPMQRDLMQRYLRKEGFTVCTASGGAQGLRLARQLLPAAITLDVMMPDVDGWSVLSTLKSETLLSEIPVIMLTMVDDPERGFTPGASEYVTKRMNRRRVSQILKKYTCLQPPCPVLVIDDELSSRSLMRAILEKEGWVVSEAGNGIEALDSMKRERPRLICLDLMMPEMHGCASAAEARGHQEWPSTPMAVLTFPDFSGDVRLRLNGN